jgi:hypothetical protein
MPCGSLKWKILLEIPEPAFTLDITRNASKAIAMHRVGLAAGLPKHPREDYRR